MGGDTFYGVVVLLYSGLTPFYMLSPSVLKKPQCNFQNVNSVPCQFAVFRGRWGNALKLTGLKRDSSVISRCGS